jgi:hypothetical protein
MSSMQKMIERINARLAALESDSRNRPGWLTRLMLSDSLPLESAEVAGSAPFAQESRSSDAQRAAPLRDA